MSLSRRKFLQLSSLASAALMTPRFLHAMAKTALPQNAKKLVVIQLSGGNDGLNTVIPVRNDLYYSGRSKIAISKTDALTLTDEAGLHPSLKAIKQLFDDGHATIINGVGYPDPNRSHFRSMDIWQTASGSNEVVTNGWIGRFLDEACDSCNIHNALAVEVDATLSLALKGAEKNGIALQDPRLYHAAASSNFIKKAGLHAKEHEGALARYLYQTLTETEASAEYIFSQSKIFKSTRHYPDTQLGKRLKVIAELVCSGSETSVYYVSHGSFDTHVNQKNRQQRLLEDLDNALSVLVADLKAAGKWDDTLIITFSEFGRRVAENASGGTDHGTSNCMFALSGKLKKAGLYNPLPNLANLDDGDLMHQIDFRSVYATILDKWLEADSKSILGRRFDKLGFL